MPRLNSPIETPPKPADKQPALHEPPQQKIPQLPTPKNELAAQLTSQALRQDTSCCLVSGYEGEKPMVKQVKRGQKRLRSIVGNLLTKSMTNSKKGSTLTSLPGI